MKTDVGLRAIHSLIVSQYMPEWSRNLKDDARAMYSAHLAFKSHKMVARGSVLHILDFLCSDANLLRRLLGECQARGYQLTASPVWYMDAHSYAHQERTEALLDIYQHCVTHHQVQMSALESYLQKAAVAASRLQWQAKVLNYEAARRLTSRMRAVDPACRERHFPMAVCGL